MKVITMTAWRRPRYFEQVIRSLEEAEGSSEYHLIVSIDAGYPNERHEMIQILQQSQIKNYTINSPSENLGCAGNTFKVLNMGFEKADRVIHIEDDTVLHPDALKWFEHNLDYYEHEPRIFSITGYANRYVSLIGDWTEENMVGLRSHFSCWGWAMWKDRFDSIKEQFGIVWKDGITPEERDCRGEEFLQIIEKSDKGSWAYALNHYWRGDRLEVCSHTSFIQNIGAEQGMFAGPRNVVRQHTPLFRPTLRVKDFDHSFADDYLEAN